MGIAVVAVGLNGETSVSKGGIGGEALVVKKPKEKIDFVREFDFPNPSQRGILEVRYL